MVGGEPEEKSSGGGGEGSRSDALEPQIPAYIHIVAMHAFARSGGRPLSLPPYIHTHAYKNSMFIMT